MKIGCNHGVGIELSVLDISFSVDMEHAMLIGHSSIVEFGVLCPIL